jgi:L-threonylcarbamoyladenylate synthase
VLEGGACEVGLESTIVDLSRDRPVLLRPGAVSREDIAAVLGIVPGDRDAAAPRASGTLAAHYAPTTPLTLVARDALASAGAGDAVLALHGKPSASRAVHWIEEPADAAAYGHDLYANLRALDASGARRILVEAPPVSPAWEAVNDRLARAAAGGAAPEDDP